MTGLSMRVAHLRSTPPFSTLGDDVLERAASLADEISVPAGYVFVFDREWSNAVFVVAEGEAAVIVDGRAERTLGAGTVIMAAPPRSPVADRTTVVASKPLRFFVFERGAYEGLASVHPHLIERARTWPPGFTA